MEPSVRQTQPVRGWIRAIRDALAEHALAVRPEHFVVGKWTIREGRELFRRLVGFVPPTHHPKATISAATPN